MKRIVVWLSLLGIAGGSAIAAESTPEALIARVESLKQGQVAWRKIEWRTCLLQGLAESRAQNKPIVLWIFIDRPIDDERC